MAISVLDTLELSVPDRLRLVAEIWESIAKSPEAIQLTPETRQLLGERLEAHRRDPNAGSTWAVIKNRLLTE